MKDKAKKLLKRVKGGLDKHPKVKLALYIGLVVLVIMHLV